MFITIHQMFSLGGNFYHTFTILHLHLSTTNRLKNPSLYSNNNIIISIYVFSVRYFVYTITINTRLLCLFTGSVKNSSPFQLALMSQIPKHFYLYFLEDIKVLTQGFNRKRPPRGLFCLPYQRIVSINDSTLSF